MEIGVEWWFPGVPRGWREVEDGGLCLMVTEFQFGKMKNLETFGDDQYTTV